MACGLTRSRSGRSIREMPNPRPGQERSAEERWALPPKGVCPHAETAPALPERSFAPPRARRRRGVATVPVLVVGATAATALAWSLAKPSGLADDVAVAPGTANVWSPVEKLASDDPTLRAIGAVELVDGMAQHWPADHRRAFLSTLAPLAVASGAERCVPPSITLAQAALESGWGRSDKARELNNLFGMKADPDQAGAAAVAWEVVDGARVDTVARFRTFESWAEAVVEHDVRLSTHPAYAPARAAGAADWRTYLEALAPVYATDPAYAERVASIVETYALDSFDDAARTAARRRGACEG